MAKRILVVDDEPSVLLLLEKALQLKGYDVMATADPEEALALMEVACADVAVVDVVMPKMPGPKLAEKIVTKCPQTAVVFMSGHAPELLPIVERRAFVPKPFRVADLYRALERVEEL